MARHQLPRHQPSHAAQATGYEIRPTLAHRVRGRRRLVERDQCKAAHVPHAIPPQDLRLPRREGQLLFDVHALRIVIEHDQPAIKRRNVAPTACTNPRSAACRGSCASTTTLSFAAPRIAASCASASNSSADPSDPAKNVTASPLCVVSERILGVFLSAAPIPPDLALTDSQGRIAVRPQLFAGCANRASPTRAAGAFPPPSS